MTRSRLFKLALPGVVALGAGTAVAIAAIPASDGTIHGCYATTAPSPTLPGQLRIVDEGVSCVASEQTLTFNQQGPVGPSGPPGDPGPPGDSGTPDTSSGSGGVATTSPFDTSQPGGPSADIFLSLDGIPGDSTDSKHKNQIAIESFAFLAKRPASTRNGTATRFSGLRLDKVYDVSSPKLFAAATSGHHIKTAIVTFSTSSDSSGTDVLTYKLSDVTVTSYEQGGANPDAKALGSLEEEVALSAGRVQVSEKTTGANGKPGVLTASWEVPKKR